MTSAITLGMWSTFDVCNSRNEQLLQFKKNIELNHLHFCTMKQVS